MSGPPLLLFHIGAGAIALLAGSAALALRKGSPRHRAAGRAFVVTMLAMAGSGALMAGFLTEWTNLLGGLTTIYFVLTAWMALRRPAGQCGAFEVLALLAALAILAGNVFFALRTEPHADDVGAEASWAFAGLMAISATGDLRLLLRGGIAGAQRLVRHLWRMCYALFIAAASLFLGQMQVFPPALRESPLLWLLPLVPLALMAFWMVRVRKGWQRPPAERLPRAL